MDVGFPCFAGAAGALGVGAEGAAGAVATDDEVGSGAWAAVAGLAGRGVGCSGGGTKAGAPGLAFGLSL
jgi:hypothetical protein